MVRIILTDRTFEYDVRSLTKAFFKDENIVVVDENYSEELKENELNDRKLNNTKRHRKNNRQIEDDKVTYEFYVSVSDNNIELRLESVEVDIDIHKSLIVDLREELDKEKDNEIVDSLEYKAKCKNILKKAIYKILSQALDIELPWGTLTGIRPSKIAMDRLCKGDNDDDIKSFMKNTYLAEDSKIELALEVAHREKEILEDIDYKNGYSLYIGIPFCPTRCSYCSFTSYPLDKYECMVEAYIEALIKEMEYASTMVKNKVLTTVYIGGGTPTTLSPEQLDRIINKLKELWDFSTVREFTVEAGRPDSITREKLQVLKEQGVTRISINPQTMKQETLDLIGRKHTVDSIVDAYNLAREVGHKNINMDLILGLPGETLDDVKYTLNRIKELDPDNLTVHTLAIKRAAYLNIYKDKYEELLPKHVTDMVDETLRYAKANGYIPYYMYRQKNMTDNLENIGYAKYGLEGIYNILIMEERQSILALGAGAVCKFVDYKDNRIERLDNVKSLKDYIERIDDMIEKKKNFVSSKGAYFDGIFR